MGSALFHASHGNFSENCRLLQKMVIFLLSHWYILLFISFYGWIEKSFMTALGIAKVVKSGEEFGSVIIEILIFWFKEQTKGIDNE